MSFLLAYRNGSITGASVTRQHPFFAGGGITTAFGMQAAAGNINALTVFPLATSLERYHGQNGFIASVTIGVELFEGGVTTGSSGTIPADDVFVSFALTPITAEAPTTNGSVEIDGKAIELRVVQTAFSSAMIQSALKYVVDSNSSLSWHPVGWTQALGSNAEEYLGIGTAGSVVTSESTHQVPWARAGTFKQLMVLAVMEGSQDDKTYTFALRVNGADVISVTAPNDVSGGTNVKLLTDAATTAAVAVGDFVSWRVSMSGGFTANRSVQFMAMVGYEDDN